MRLFIAVLLDDEVKDAICSVRDELETYAKSGRITRRENLHLTLAFLGDTPPSRIAALRRVMAAAASGGFELKFSGIGRFKRRGGDIWWLGTEKSPALTGLAARLEALLRTEGFDLEARDFRPHLTLGREIYMPPEFKASDIKTAIPVQYVDSIYLMNSERLHGVLTYTPIFGQKL